MLLERRQVNFKDARGTIADIFVNDPKQHCALIETYKGGVRGNHYHKHSRQHDFIISGTLEVFSQRVGDTKIDKAIVGPYELITWDPEVAHEYIALEDSVMLTFVDGVRGGENYEMDTHRLSTPLHEQVKY